MTLYRELGTVKPQQESIKSINTSHHHANVLTLCSLLYFSHMHTFVHTETQQYRHTHTHTPTNIPTRINAHLYIQENTHANTRTDAHTYVKPCVHSYTNTEQQIGARGRWPHDQPGLLVCASMPRQGLGEWVERFFCGRHDWRLSIACVACCVFFDLFAQETMLDMTLKGPERILTCLVTKQEHN